MMRGYGRRRDAPVGCGEGRLLPPVEDRQLRETRGANRSFELGTRRASRGDGTTQHLVNARELGTERIEPLVA